MEHSDTHQLLSPAPDCIWIASFDIGKKNFAFCIEEVNLKKFEDISDIHKNDRYCKDGSLTVEFSKNVRKVIDNGKIILLTNKDLMEGASTKKHLDPRILINLTQHLDEYTPFWDKCSVFLVEQQMGFGKRQNTMALKIGQHCMSYFLIRFAGFKYIIEFPAYYKTKIMGAPKKMTKHMRKKWSVNEAIQILVNRGDTQTLSDINSRKKKDDVADVITQLQSFKYLHYIDKQEF